MATKAIAIMDVFIVWIPVALIRADLYTTVYAYCTNVQHGNSANT